jgi:hypothetical protein
MRGRPILLAARGASSPPCGDQGGARARFAHDGREGAHVWSRHRAEHFEGTVQGKPTRITTVWLKQGGVWKAASVQLTTIAANSDNEAVSSLASQSPRETRSLLPAPLIPVAQSPNNL